MKTVISFLLLITLLAPAAGKVEAQGCSDAGFCSIGALGQQHADTALHQKSQQLTFLSAVGLGDEKVLIVVPGLQYDIRFSRHWELQAKLTAGYASGSLGNAAGWGDAIVSGIYTFPAGRQWKVSLTAGVKMPLDRANLQKDGRSLPLQYQSSLGTVDIITGLSVSHARWQLAAGWQQPVSGANRNAFSRKADLLLRAARLFQTRRSIRFNAGLLGIYHLGNDLYTNSSVSPLPVPIHGSKGLTLNITGGVWLPLHKQLTIGVTGGAPVIARAVRPDGLTRKFVIAPELSFHF